MRRLLTALVACTCTALLPAPAHAHTPLVHAAPRPGDKVRPGVEIVSLTFGRLRRDAAHQVNVTQANGITVDRGDVRLLGETTLCLTVKPLRVGVHAVAYTVVSPDGEEQKGRYYFTVLDSGRTATPALACTGDGSPMAAQDRGQQNTSANRQHIWGLAFMGVGVVLAAVAAALLCLPGCAFVGAPRAERGPFGAVGLADVAIDTADSSDAAR